MRMARYVPLLLIALLAPLAGCAGMGAGSSDTLEPDPSDAVEQDVVEAEPAEPEPTLEDRWRAPFSVMSRGRPATRQEREVVLAVAPPADTGTTAGERDSSAVAPPGADTAGANPPGDQTEADSDEESRAEDEEGRDAQSAGSDAAPRTHRVEWGETWFGIARRYGVSSTALAALNPDVDPEQLRAGEVILIPAPDAPATGRRTHTVVSGDSLWGISRRYGVSIERLREANRLEDDRVRIGQVLIIP